MTPVIRACLGAPALAIVLLWLLGLAGCALPPPTAFTEQTPDGVTVTFTPMPRNVVASIGLSVEPHYRVDAVALRQSRAVWFADDITMNRGLIAHELKHFRRDPASPTGYCEHLADGVTWVHGVCQ